MGILGIFFSRLPFAAFTPPILNLYFCDVLRSAFFSFPTTKTMSCCQKSGGCCGGVANTGAYDLKSKALVAQKAPYAVDLKTGDVKYWCSCGYSKAQPFCDGSHSKAHININAK